MLTNKMPKLTEEKLEFGDYVPIFMLGLKNGNVQTAEASDTLVDRQELFLRIQKQRGEVVPQIQKPSGDLIDVRIQTAAACDTGWTQQPEIEREDDQIVA